MPTQLVPRTCLASSIAILLSSGSIFAASPASNPLPEVVVTATENQADTPVSPSITTAKEKLQSVPGAVSVVSQQDYQSGRGSYIQDFIQYSPGVIIQANQGTEASHISIRGSGNDDDNIIGLTVLLDGIPMNQADGEAFLQDIDLQSVKYSEVYRGANAFKYGGVALGGAINFVTKTGRDADPFTAGLSLGSFGFVQGQASSGWSNGPWDLYVSGVAQTLSGYRAHSQENDQKFFLSLGYQFSPYAENRLYFFFGRLDQNNPVSLTKEQMYHSPRQTSDQSIQQDFNTSWNYFRVMDSFAIKKDDWSLLLSVEYNHRQQSQLTQFDDDDPDGALRFYSDDLGADVTFESKAELFGQKNRFTIALVPSWEAESDGFYENQNGHFGPLVFSDRTYFTNIPFLIENQHYLTSHISLLTGAQVVYVNRIFRGENTSDLGFQVHDDHYLAFNPKLGVTYEWTDKTMAYINFSGSFQPASFDESLNSVGNPGGGEQFNTLHSEKAFTLEVGTRGEMGPLEWDLALYRSWIRDELIELANASGAVVESMNAPKSIHQGIELGTQLEVAHDIFAKGVHLDASKDGKTIATDRNGDRLVFRQSYNYSDFRFSGNPVYGNNRIGSNPVAFYKAELRYEHPCGIYFGPNVEWNIVKYPVDEANTLYADPYALLGFKAGYKTKKGLQVYFEAKNILNKTYADNVSPIADARLGDSDAFNPGNGRAFYGGVSWIW